MVPVAGIMQAPSVLEVTRRSRSKHRRVHRLRQGQSGQDRSRHRRQRQPAAHVRRIVHVHDRRQAQRGGLSRRRPGADRSHLRPDPGDVRGHHLVDRLSARRKLRPLGVTSAKRSAALPDVPPIADTVPGYDAAGWFGLGAPKATPAPVIDTLSNAVAAALGRSGHAGEDGQSRRRTDADGPDGIRQATSPTTPRNGPR